MESHIMDAKQMKTDKSSTILVAIDFSFCSVLALRKAKSFMAQKPVRILVLHVIDEDFVERCVRHNLGTEKDLKKKLFLRAKEQLAHILREEKMDGDGVEEIVCEGAPYLEINKKALRQGMKMVVVAS